jgi:hypothetical protein
VKYQNCEIAKALAKAEKKFWGKSFWGNIRIVKLHSGEIAQIIL